MKKFLLPLVLILYLTLTLMGDCWVSGYDQRIKVTTDHTKVDATLSNFPVTAFFTSAQAEEIFVEFDADEDFDRGQFALGDDTLLYADCELFDDSAQKGIYHFKVTSVSSSAGTDIYFYYDNDHAHNTTYISKSGGTAAQSAWDSNFKAIYHMNDALVYDTQYEASVEPDSDGWTLGGTDYASVAGGILTIDTSADDTYTCYYYKTPDVDFDAGFYFKARIKASTDMIANNDHFEIKILDGTQNEYTKLRIYDGKYTYVYSGGVATITEDTTTDYYIYEIYIIGTSLKIYRDGVVKADQTVATASISDNVGFGDYLTSVMTKIEMDYLYYALDVDFNPALIDILDSTSNNNDGTKKDANEPVEATGKVGQGQDFDGSDDYIATGSAIIAAGDNNYTVEVRFKLDQLPSVRGTASDFISDRADVGNNFYKFRIIAQTSDIVSSLVYSDTGYTMNDSTTSVVAGTWTSATFVVDDTNNLTKLYFNDAEEDSDANTNHYSTANVTNIGRVTGATTENHVEGIIDEVRCSNTVRTAAWIKATYNSLWDSLLTYGSEETSEEDNAILFGTNL